MRLKHTIKPKFVSAELGVQGLSWEREVEAKCIYGNGVKLGIRELYGVYIIPVLLQCV